MKPLASSLLVVLCWTLPAGAQSSVDKSMAESLFRHGRQLMEQGDFDQACPKLAESQRLDPSTGTLLNLAVCHESQGKLASAWLEYVEVGRRARRDGQADRQRFADQHAQALAPKLPHLTLSLREQPGAADIVVKLDGVALGVDALGVATPVDPGDHVVTASAPGRKEWTTTTRLAVAQRGVVEIPVLEPADTTAPPAPVPTPVAPGSAAPTAAAPTPAAAPAPRQTALPLASARSRGAPADVEPSRPITPAIWIAGGATLACAIGAVITGIQAHDSAETFDTMNQSPRYTADQRSSQRDEAFNLQLANTALVGATVVGAVVTSVLFLTRPSEPATVGFSPWLAPSSAGLVARGTL